VSKSYNPFAFWILVFRATQKTGASSSMIAQLYLLTKLAVQVILEFQQTITDDLYIIFSS